MRTTFEKAYNATQKIFFHLILVTVIVFWTLIKVPKLLHQYLSERRVTHERKVTECDENSTVIEQNVEIFANLDDWWNPRGKLSTLHKFNVIRIPFIQNGILAHTGINTLNNIKILDVGCGGGILSEGLAKAGALVTGIDASAALIMIAKEHRNLSSGLPNSNPIYHHNTIEEHVKTHPNYYDAVVASEVIEHVNNPKLFLKSCVETLKSGGVIFLTTPNRTIWSYLTVIFFCEKVISIIPKGAHEYSKLITPRELSEMLTENNCSVVSNQGIILNIITRHWQFIKPRSLMYAIQAVKLN
ncbi:ubiquinone biosynthesis O-methyltransferase isoform X2 [Bombyx mori]|uniref:ubiquinone biosynthesis O-methyltransferase isoform X2 n=1 Tax=Bombyx mori TaxID=7091 RepID=UPI0006409ABD